ncbi:hypothetical protein LINPERHAP1_LOCUS30260, partial [Linum perenne]
LSVQRPKNQVSTIRKEMWFQLKKRMQKNLKVTNPLIRRSQPPHREASN